MILAIDMGNTNIVIGGIDNDRTYFVERVTTNSGKTDLEYAVNIKSILEIHSISASSIEGAILSSVVPPLNSTILSAVEKICGFRPMLVGSGMKTGTGLSFFIPIFCAPAGTLRSPTGPGPESGPVPHDRY